MSLADTFNSDNFGMISLTESIQEVPFKPARVGEMGLFAPKPIATRTVVIESRGGILRLLPTASRGAPGRVGKAPKRVVRSFLVPHIPYDDTILADDVQGVRKFGSEDETEAVAEVVNERLELMRQSHEVTLEHMRMGAIRGVISTKDPDETGVVELFNLFTEFDVSEQTQVDLSTSSTPLVHVIQAKRLIELELGGVPISGFHAFCGDDWFDAFKDLDDVKTAYDRWLDGEFLRTDQRKGFLFGGVLFENYTGSVSGVDFMPKDEARIFPLGVPGLFVTAFAPADFIETVNTLGLPLYASQRILDHNRGIEIHTQSNPLPLCTIPRVLIKAT